MGLRSQRTTGRRIAIDYPALADACSVGEQLDIDRFTAVLLDSWLTTYRLAWGERTILEIPIHGFTYPFDATSPPGDIDNRVLGVVGRSAPPVGPRDRSRMAGYPSPQRGSLEAVDRGHLVALSMGGGYDINLVPQVAAVNRRGRWRAIERYCASHPGTFFFVHCDYTDGSDRPSELEYGWLADHDFHVETFSN